MILLRTLFALALLLAAALPAAAQTPLTGAERPAAAAVSYTGPGDIVSGATAWYGLRAYSGAIVTAGTQALVNLRRSSDSHTCDIIVSASGGLGNTANCSTGGDNGTAVASWCNSTTCYVKEFYDQSGNGQNATQSGNASQPSLTLSCFGSLPCAVFSGGQAVDATLGGSVSQPFTISYVAERTGATSSYNDPFGDAGTVQVGFNAGANAVFIYASGGAPTATVADNAAHAVQNVFNGASSVINVDGTSNTVNTGTNALGTTASATRIGEEGDGNHWMNGYFAEVGVWGSAFSSGNRTSMCHNQYTYWGTATSC